MVASIRECVIVQPDGLIEIRKTGLLPGARADVFIVPEPSGAAQPAEVEDFSGDPVKSRAIETGESLFVRIIDGGPMPPSPLEPDDCPLDWDAGIDVPPIRHHDYINIQIVEGGYRHPAQLNLGD